MAVWINWLDISWAKQAQQNLPIEEILGRGKVQQWESSDLSV